MSDTWSEYNLYKRKLEKIFNQISKIAFKGRDNKQEYFDYIEELIVKGDYGAYQQSVYYFFQIDIDSYRDLAEIKEKTWSEILYQTRTPFLTKLSKLYKEKGVYQSSFDIYSENLNIININLSQPLSSTYSSTSATQSISFTKGNGVIYVNVLDSSIFNITISKSNWVNNLPTDIEQFQIVRTGTSSNTYQTNIPTTHSNEFLVSVYKRSEYDEKNYKLEIVRNSLLGQIYERETYNQNVDYLVRNKLFSRVIGETTFYLEVQKVGATSSYIINTDNPTLSDVQNLINNYKTAINYLLS